MKSSPRHIIRVAVVGSDPVRYVGLRAIFSSESDIQVRAATVRSVVQSQSDDIIVLAVDRGTVFLNAMATLKSQQPGICIIVTGPENRDEDILRAIAAGAKGYVGEEASPAEFKKAVREVHAGSVWLPRRVIAAFIERSTYAARVGHSRKETSMKISDREREVLRLLVAGCSNKEIAGELGIIERTVKAHVAQLLRKIGAPNRIALSVHAVTHSLLEPQQ
jgi:DNA-binding NarL/FixJ family response regulator